MTGDGPLSANSPTPPIVPPRAPGNRVSAGFVIAIAIAVLMLLGIIGLVAAALLGDDDEPTGAGLGPQVNVDAPATAPPGEESDESADTAPAETAAVESATVSPDSDAPVTDAADAGDDTDAPAADAAAPPVGDDDFSDDPDESLPSLTTLPGVNELDQPDSSDLPEPGDEPVILPVQVTTPAPPSTFPAVPFEQFGPSAVAALAGWSEHDRSSDHVSFTRDGEMVEVFTLDGVANADDALARFYDDVEPDLEELTRSPIERLGAPSARFLSVAGSEYVATTARQQATSTMSGSIVAAVRPDGSAVVVTTSRSGESSPAELADDAELLGAILAHL